MDIRIRRASNRLKFMTREEKLKLIAHVYNSCKTTEQYWQEVAEGIAEMSPKEFKNSLVKAGIITPDGKLTETYRKGEKNEQ